MWAAWHFGGEDPWRLYNMLDEDYRPVAAPERGPIRPQNPRRVKAFLYACANYSARTAGVSAGSVKPAPAKNRAQRRAAKRKARRG